MDLYTGRDLPAVIATCPLAAVSERLKEPASSLDVTMR